MELVYCIVSAADTFHSFLQYHVAGKAVFKLAARGAELHVDGERSLVGA